MLRRSPTGSWIPAWVPQSTTTLSVLLMLCSIVQSATNGYDSSMLNGLNILPVYADYFQLNAVTTGLNTASVFIGGIVGYVIAGYLTDWLGRRAAIFWGSFISIVGIVIQTCAQDIAAFVAGRIILGFGTALSGVAGSVYLAEAFPSRHRAWGVGLLNDFYYVGALIAAGITLGTGTWQSTWAWRAPSLIQAIFSLLCIAILPFVPESPRWLVSRGLLSEAHTAIAQTNANGNESLPIVRTIYLEIVSSLDSERGGKTTQMTPLQIFRDPVARKRLLIGMSPGPFSAIAGNVIASYYLGAELATAGITDSTAQLQANVVLNVWCLVCALAGTQLCARWGRKPTALASQCLLVVFLFVIGGLSRAFARTSPGDVPSSLVYGNVACMFLFQGIYSVAWTPLLYLYPPEVMNYAIRANGLAFSQFLLNAAAIILLFLIPIGLQNIGWRIYMINGAWDVVIVVIIALFWVETKGKTLEEIDVLFTGPHGKPQRRLSIDDGPSPASTESVDLSTGKHIGRHPAERANNELSVKDR